MPVWRLEDWCWSWYSNTLDNWCVEPTHLKRPWCWERLKAGEERDDRGWDGWMASPTRWTWVWVSSGSWWWTGGLACRSPWGHKESNTTERLNWTEWSHVSLVTQMVKNPSAVQKTWVWSLGQEDALEKGMTTHFSILAWKIPWTSEEPGRRQPMGSQRVRHDWMTNTHTLSAPMHRLHTHASLTLRNHVWPLCSWTVPSLARVSQPCFTAGREDLISQQWAGGEFTQHPAPEPLGGALSPPRRGPIAFFVRASDLTSNHSVSNWCTNGY